ncbi:DDE superfamily endonuclease domain [Phytophthora cactorum]|nr:DDE superfamily endonuclease domain [Phytophthora cactorum]
MSIQIHLQLISFDRTSRHSTSNKKNWKLFTLGLYVRELLQYEMDAPSVLLLDIFDTHVSEKDIGVVTKKTSALVCWLPANSTAVSQPSDVGVMKHLKKKSTALWVARPASPQKSLQTWDAAQPQLRSVHRGGWWGCARVRSSARAGASVNAVCCEGWRKNLLVGSSVSAGKSVFATVNNNATSTEATEEERKKAAAKRKKQNQVIVRAND